MSDMVWNPRDCAYRERTPEHPRGSYEACTHPDKLKCPWRVGQTVYLVSGEAIKKEHQYTIDINHLGKKYVIYSLIWGYRSKYAIMTLKPFSKSSTELSIINANQMDLSKENTFINPFLPFPKWIDTMSKMKMSGDSSHDAHYAMYITDKSNDESWDGLTSGCNRYRYEDMCDDCYEGDCDNCNRTDVINIDTKLPIKGFINTNTGCWGDGMDIWTAVKNNFGDHPNRMALLLPSEYLYQCDTYLDKTYDRPEKDTFTDIQKFIGYMKEARAIPREVQVPEDNEVGQDLMFKINLEKISPDRMYWYFCTLRAPVQFPGVIQATVHLIEKEGFDPLLAYIMAQVVNPNFHGGHAVIEPSALRQSGATILDPNETGILGSKRVILFLPKIENVLQFAVRSYKFLTTNTGTYVTEANSIAQWSLNRHLLFDIDNVNYSCWNKEAPDAFRIRFKIPEGISLHNINTFSVAKRKLIPEGV